MKKLFTFLAAVCVAAAAYAGEFADISVSEVKGLVESKKAVIIDVNGSKSYAAGRVPGAIDYAAVKDKLASVLPADKNTRETPSDGLFWKLEASRRGPWIYDARGWQRGSGQVRQGRTG